MDLNHCYDNVESVQMFLRKARECLPFLVYLAIENAYSERDKMFKVVALTHIKNYFLKAKVAPETIRELISLLDSFRDPYQEFLEKRANCTWSETKEHILGGLL
ncbi:hypothetical protein [Neobacillus sp.]|jgi:hypothetical protein|uniref:hypothetical protein n=1 Tax=Neobacillus sp. TaxID=2675273 RepID=UPI0035B54408